MNKNTSAFYKTYIDLTRRYRIRVHSKDEHWKPLWLFIHHLLKILSFGKMKTFYTNYTTVIGKDIYFPAGWRIDNAKDIDFVTLCHEADHIKWNIRLGMGNALLGAAIMGILYLFIPLPVGLAWFRYYFERSAYVQTHYALKKLGYPSDVNRYIELLTGPGYLWTWPFKKRVRKWFEKQCL